MLRCTLVCSLLQVGVCSQHLTEEFSGLMRLAYTQAQQSFRADVRAWLHTHLPQEPLASFDTAKGFEAHRAWEQVLSQGNFSMVTWPKEYGGRGANLIEWLIFEEEYHAANAPGRVNQNGIFLLGPTLMEYGTPAQKTRFLPTIANGDEIWAQAWSEPNAGSDMAAIRTHALPTGDGYVINGQKIWTSRAVFADWCFGLFRTDPDSSRHRGLSMILVPLDAQGVTIRPIRQLDGEPGFAEIFFDDVVVPKANLLGPEHGGWKVAMSCAGFERGLMLRSPARFQQTAKRLIELCRSNAKRLSAQTKAAVIQAWMDAEAYCHATHMTACRMMRAEKPGAETSCNKIFWSELDKQMHGLAMSVLGARAELVATSPDALDAGSWLDGYMFSLAGPIYAGSNEIQRNIIAERVLGLPRA